MSHDCCVALSRDAMGLSANCDFGISCSYSLMFYYVTKCKFTSKGMAAQLPSLLVLTYTYFLHGTIKLELHSHMTVIRE